jgi:hypothetical protein
MPTFDWTVGITDIALGVIALGVVPLVRFIAGLLIQMRDMLRELNLSVSALQTDVADHGEMISRHHDWLTELRAERRLRSHNPDADGPTEAHGR